MSLAKGDKISVRKSDGSGEWTATYDGDGSCRDCGALVRWVTTPKGKKMPLDADPDGADVFSAHWDRCTKEKPQGSSAPAAQSPRKPSIEDRVKRLEEAVFGKKAAAVEAPRNTDFPPPDDTLPF